MIFDVDRVEPGQHLHHAVVLAGSSTDHQDRIATAEALSKRCVSSSGKACRFIAAQLSRSLRLSISSIRALSIPLPISASRAVAARSVFSNTATMRSPDHSSRYPACP